MTHVISILQEKGHRLGAAAAYRIEFATELLTKPFPGSAVADVERQPSK